MTYELTPERLAALATINWCEGSPDYNEAFGYAPFNNLGPHPGTKFPFGNTYTTAHGAYQFLLSTWQYCVSGLGIEDYMSPENQDQAALYLIDVKRKALGFIDAGDMASALDSLSYEWASLPPGRYGQPIKQYDEVLDYFADSLAFYRGEGTLSPVGYNEVVKKKYLRSTPSRLLPSRFYWRPLLSFLSTKKRK